MSAQRLALAGLSNIKCKGIITPSLQKDSGFDDSEQIRRTNRAHNMDSGFFRGEHETTAQQHCSFFGSAVLGGFKACRSLIPVRQPDTAPPPLFDDKATVIATADKGPIMASSSLDASARQPSRFPSLDLDDLLQGQDTAHAEVDRLAKELAIAAAPLAGLGDGNCGVVIRAILEALTAHGLYVDPKTQPKTPPKKQIIPQGLRTKVLERDAYRCVYCATHVDLSVDHIKPESKGGTLDFDNLQTLCRPCNSSKGAKE